MTPEQIAAERRYAESCRDTGRDCVINPAKLLALLDAVSGPPDEQPVPIDPEVASLSVWTLELGARERKAIQKIGTKMCPSSLNGKPLRRIETIGDLAQLDAADLAMLRDCGATTISRINGALQKHGLSLRREIQW